MRPLLRCVELVESVTDWMEGAMGDRERHAVEGHLVICPHCTEYVHQLRYTGAVLRAADAIGRHPPPSTARTALLETFRRERRTA